MGLTLAAGAVGVDRPGEAAAVRDADAEQHGPGPSSRRQGRPAGRRGDLLRAV